MYTVLLYRFERFAFSFIHFTFVCCSLAQQIRMIRIAGKIYNIYICDVLCHIYNHKCSNEPNYTASGTIHHWSSLFFRFYLSPIILMIIISFFSLSFHNNNNILCQCTMIYTYHWSGRISDTIATKMNSFSCSFIFLPITEWIYVRIIQLNLLSYRIHISSYQPYNFVQKFCAKGRKLLLDASNL